MGNNHYYSGTITLRSDLRRGDVLDATGFNAEQAANWSAADLIFEALCETFNMPVSELQDGDNSTFFIDSPTNSLEHALFDRLAPFIADSSAVEYQSDNDATPRRCRFRNGEALYETAALVWPDDTRYAALITAADRVYAAGDGPGSDVDNDAALQAAIINVTAGY